MTTQTQSTRRIALPAPALLVVTNRRATRMPLGEVVAAAAAAGCPWISVREKDLPDDEQILLVRQLLPLVHGSGALLSLHGEAGLAHHAGADGVHLPAGADVGRARALLGPRKLIGVSIHTVTDAEALAPEEVDYALAGPAFETLSKPGYGPEIGRRGLREIAAATPVPVLAIGGINAARVAELIVAGAAGVAVMGAVMRAADPAREVTGLLAALKGVIGL